MKTTELNLSTFISTSKAVKDRTITTVFFHLVEELGEVTVNINRPHKADESLAGELADVLNCTLDIGMQAFGRPLKLPTSVDLETLYEKPTAEDLLLDLSASVGCVAPLLNAQDDLEVCLNAVVLNTMLIYTSEYGYDLTELQVQLDKKCAKWLKVAGV